MHHLHRSTILRKQRDELLIRLLLLTIPPRPIPAPSNQNQDVEMQPTLYASHRCYQRSIAVSPYTRYWAHIRVQCVRNVRADDLFAARGARRPCCYLLSIACPPRHIFSGGTPHASFLPPLLLNTPGILQLIYSTFTVPMPVWTRCIDPHSDLISLCRSILGMEPQRTEVFLHSY